jgi:hypothetical protein
VFIAASKESLWSQHRGKFKSTPHKNSGNSTQIKELPSANQMLTGQ